MRDSIKTFAAAIVAGMFIAMGATAYLKVGGVMGAVLFAFGLIAIVHYKIPLYTGRAGFITSGKEILPLLIIIAGNAVGCFLISLLFEQRELAMPIVEKRMSDGILMSGIRGIPCGIIMTTCVKFARDGKFLPLLFGVPAFIVCGFAHSIADIFYYFVAMNFSIELAGIWISVILGNFIGCNFVRMIVKDQQ